MVPMPEMATVWCVHLETGNPLDTKGTLVLDEGAVAFSGQDGRETRIHFTKVRQVKRVLGSPILVVSHDPDGEWEFLCGTTDKPKDAREILLGEVVDLDERLLEVADLPVGWRALRADPDGPWMQEPFSS